MPKIISATEAKNKFGAVLRWIDQNRDEVILESRGEPTAVIMSYQEYERIKHLKEQTRRQEALIRLEALRERILSRNEALTPDEGDAIADRFGREVVEDMARDGTITFNNS